MSRRTFRPVPNWTEDELRVAQHAAVERFIAERLEEGPRDFLAAYDTAEHRVRTLLEATDDLTDFASRLLVEQPDLVEVARYICAPPISQEDIWTLAGGKLSMARPDPTIARATATALLAALDPRRFRWVAEERSPTEHERELAVAATSAMFALEALRTQRRLASSTDQEAEVAEALTGAGLTRAELDRRSITVLDELPRGHFTREAKVAGSKCDVPVRMHDGRLLAIECKVSNGPKNGWKRLHREAGGKANAWSRAFGEQIVPAAVLAGVYDLSCLVKGQDDYGLTLFWQHDLNPLVAFATTDGA